MKAVRYPETIFCGNCRDHVKMTDCRRMEQKNKGRMQIEFDYVCVTCGHRGSEARDWEFLQFSEREFCVKNGLSTFGAGASKQGVIYERVQNSKKIKVAAGK